MVDDDPDFERALVFLPYPLLLKAARIAQQRNYDRQVTDEFIDDVLSKSDADQVVNYPVATSYVHSHAQGEPVEPHMRCEILGPWGNEEIPWTKICLDVDMNLFIQLPNTSIYNYNEETGHLPSA
jgi:hypothetical protein|tara:strand:+ start:371 stop:745 length:375 start_codon:yes stop_codon:yes gene_type:complete